MSTKKFPIRDKSYFKDYLWREMRRYEDTGKRVRTTVTCTEDNIDNLYNSQFADKTPYGQIFYYNIDTK